MTKEEYEVYVDLFESDGWKKFQESITGAEEQLTVGAFSNCVTNDQWQFVRGQLQQLKNIAAYEQYIKISYENELKEKEDNYEE